MAGAGQLGASSEHSFIVCALRPTDPGPAIPSPKPLHHQMLLHLLRTQFTGLARRHHRSLLLLSSALSPTMGKVKSWRGSLSRALLRASIKHLLSVRDARARSLLSQPRLRTFPFTALLLSFLPSSLPHDGQDHLHRVWQVELTARIGRAPSSRARPASTQLPLSQPVLFKLPNAASLALRSIHWSCPSPPPLLLP